MRRAFRAAEKMCWFLRFQSEFVTFLSDKMFYKCTLQETWLEFLWCRERLSENRGCRESVSVMPRENQWKRAKIPVHLVLSRVPFKSEVWNWAYKMPKYVLSLLVKPKLKNLLSVLRYRLSRFRIRRQNQRVTTFWRHKSIEIVRLNYKLVSICGPFRSKNKTW